MREYAIVEESHVTDEVKSAHERHLRFHDLYDGLTWRLARDPLPRQAEEIAPETFLVKSTSWDYLGFCVIFIVYTINNSAERIDIVDMWVDDV